MLKGILWSVVLFLLLLPGVSLAEASGEPVKGATEEAVHEAVAEATDQVDLITVETEPPLPREETIDIEEKPSKTVVWVAGYWRWDRVKKRYVWMSGVWREPPSGLIWHAGRWKNTKKGWVWIGGHWGKKGEKELVVVKSAPPPPNLEVRSPKPGPGYVWVGGHWKSSAGGHVWVPGKWRNPPKPGRVWLKGRWVKRPGGYVYVSGHWDYSPHKRVIVTKPPRRPPSPKRHPLHPPPKRKARHRPPRPRR